MNTAFQGNHDSPVSLALHDKQATLQQGVLYYNPKASVSRTLFLCFFSIETGELTIAIKSIPIYEYARVNPTEERAASSHIMTLKQKRDEQIETGLVEAG